MKTINGVGQWLSTLRLRWLLCGWIVGAIAVSVLRSINTATGLAWPRLLEVPLSVALIVVAIWWIVLHRNWITSRRSGQHES